jgi:DNA-binding transcriptional MerR regulator
MESVAKKLTDPRMVVLTTPAAESPAGVEGSERMFLQQVKSGQASEPVGEAQGYEVEAADLLDFLEMEAGSAVQIEPERTIQIVAASNCDIMLAEDNPTGKNAFAVLLDRLQEVELELQAAGFTIGKMQAQLEGYNDQLKLLPDFEAQALKLAEAEKQNRELRKRLPELENNARQITQLQRENDELRWQLEEHYSKRRRRLETPVKLMSLRFWKELISEVGRLGHRSAPAGPERLSKSDKQWAFLSAHTDDRIQSGDRF